MKFFLVLISLSFFGSRPVFAAESRATFYCEETDDNYSPFAPEALTFEKLRKIILDPHNGIHSVNDLLRHFASDKIYRRMLENPVLNPVSFALHKEDVTPDFPRLLIHQHRMIMMMVTDQQKASSELIEIQEYVPETHKFMFRLINFNALGTAEMFTEDAGTTPISFNDVANERTDYVPPFTEKLSRGTASCNSCHDRSYSYEPYQPNSDLLPRWNIPSQWKQPFAESIAPASKQAQWWRRYQKTLGDDHLGARFKILPAIRTSVSSGGQINFLDRPNLALTEHLNRLNDHRIADLITSSDRYSGMKYAVAAAFLGCANLEDFLPLPYRSFHGEPPNPASLGEETESPVSGAGDDLELVDSKPTFDRLRYLLSTDVKTWRWGIADDTVYSAQEDDNRFVAPRAALQNVMACEIGPQFLKENPDLDYFAGRPFTFQNLTIPKSKFCDLLKAKSWAAISSQPWGKIATPRRKKIVEPTWVGECHQAWFATASIRPVSFRGRICGSAEIYAYDKVGNLLGEETKNFDVKITNASSVTAAVSSTTWQRGSACYVNYLIQPCAMK